LAGEGKTTTSMNLAIALARQQKKVLLVDVDLRKPASHKPADLQGNIGLIGLLSSEALGPAIIQSRVPNLSILPVGDSDLGHAELLVSSQMRRLIARWRQEYDHVIFDCPPVLGVSETVRLAAGADAVLLVVRSGQTTREAFHRAQIILQQVHVNLVGVVLNGVDLRSPEFSYHYGYMQNYKNVANS
jgi:succinoglycan biosynthesis transport protein ExoP